jgi:O-antigen ligase
MVPVTFLLLLFPYVSRKHKILLLSVSFLSVITAPDFRSVQVKLSIAVLFVLGYYFRKFINKKILLFIHSTIFIVPFFFIVGAVYFDYNFFKDGVSSEEYIVNVGENESNLRADTRTFLYVEILADLKGYEWLLGKSAIGSYQSSFFGMGGADDNGKRYSCEVGILNILLRNGIIGVLIYMILLFRLTRRAIRNSNNYLISSLALLLAFRWPLTFIEEFTEYDLNFFFFWTLLGLISIYKVQKFTDNEVKIFIQSKRNNISLHGAN